MLILVAPFLVLGIVLALSLFGLAFGLPLLAVTVPITLAAARARREPDEPDRRRRLGIAAIVLAITLSAGLIAVLITSAGELDLAVEWVLLVVSIGWIAAAWWAAARSRAAARKEFGRTG